MEKTGMRRGLEPETFLCRSVTEIVDFLGNEGEISDHYQAPIFPLKTRNSIDV